MNTKATKSRTPIGADPEVSPMTIVSDIRKLDPHIECGSDDWFAYALILGSAYYGANEQTVAARLDLPLARLSWMADNLRTNKIWKDGKLSLHPDDFICAAACARGLMDKVQEEQSA